MKKLAASFLLWLFLVNITGHHLAYYIAGWQQDKHVEVALDNHAYNEAELITLKVPINMPYQYNTSTYERVDGEINIEGKLYKYVKRKIEDGHLVLLCLPDYNKMRLQQVKDDFSKDANNVAQSTPTKKEGGSKHKANKPIKTDCITAELVYNSAIIYNAVVYRLTDPFATLHSRPHTSPEQPPELG